MKTRNRQTNRAPRTYCCTSPSDGSLSYIIAPTASSTVPTMRSALVLLGLFVAGCAPAPSTSPVPVPSGGALYMPRDVKAAFRKGTRSPDGRPGPAYWQNRGRYNIAITALPPDRTIRGDEQITYFNNSPDTLRNPVIKLLLKYVICSSPR